ncbi:hypothetical protein [Paenibacillus harenae]|nr:hypothetical protein [Paenibacillus harenae]
MNLEFVIVQSLEFRKELEPHVSGAIRSLPMSLEKTNKGRVTIC